MATLIKIDRNGSKHYEGAVVCPRCGGEGIFYIGTLNGVPKPSWVDDGICFQCGGTGKIHGKWIERTPEYQAKLDARREAKQKAEQERIEAERQQMEAERQARELAKAEKEAEIKAQKAKSQFRGAIGDKIDEDVTYVHSGSWEQPSFKGWGTDTMFAHTFRDSEGNALVWKTTSNPMGKFVDDEWIPFTEGQQIHLKGSIKEFKEYKDEKQTYLTRCKVIA